MAKALEKLHLLPLAERISKIVSRHSRWPDHSWKFDNTNAGSLPVMLNWDFEMPDGSSFMDPKWSPLREAAKQFEWSLLVDSQSEYRQIKPASLHPIHLGLRLLMYWMATADYADFGELDSRASEQYLRYVADTKQQRIKSGAESDDAIDMALDEQGDLSELDALVEQGEQQDEPEDKSEKLLGFGAFRYCLIPLVLLFQQRFVLQEAGVPAPSEPPFAGRPVNVVAQSLATSIVSTIPPVPDEVYIPTIKKAIEWMGIPAKDIIRLQTDYLSFRQMVGEDNKYKAGPDRVLLGSVIESFEFSLLPETGKPWHDPIGGPYCRLADRTEILPTNHLRRLIGHLRDASVIVLQGTMGNRISEVCGLQAYPINTETGFPACIEIRSSRNGLYDVFYVKGRVFKMHAQGKETTWVAGLRLKGTDYIPPPIQAILVLEELNRPWRDLAGVNDLIVGFMVGTGLPNAPESILSVNSGKLLEGQRRWISEFVDLPEEFKDWVVSTHQWRKSFAQYMVMADSRLLRPVCEHFQHVSIAMTESAYVGNDVVLLRMVDDYISRNTARMMYEMGTGEVKVAGRMAEWVEERREQIRAITAGKTKDEAIDALEQELRSEDVKVYGCDWGWCFYRSEVSRCNHHRGQFLLLAKAPDFANRNPKTCCACANLAVTGEHKVFWLKRHQDWSKALVEHKQAGNEGMVLVAQDNVNQSESVLRMMGEDVYVGGNVA